jgi:hypothetical protein
MKNDGGTAFPDQGQIILANGQWNDGWSPGMSLRDWFAGEALKGILSNPALIDTISQSTPDWIAIHAGLVADAMLKNRPEDSDG